MHFHVTQVQITNNAHTFKTFSVLLFCDVFSCKLLTQVIIQFLLQFGIISICKFFKVYKVLLTCGLVQLFFVFEKFTLLTITKLQSKSCYYLDKLQTLLFNYYICYFNPLTLMSDQDRISPYNINTISTTCDEYHFGDN